MAISAAKDLIDPSSGGVFDTVIGHDPVQVDAILERAQAAQHRWRHVPLDDRVNRLREVGRLLRTEVEEHATLISREMGKPITQARAEVLKCALTCDFYADHAHEFLDAQQVATNAVNSFVAYEPIGVVLAVMPWNYPYWQVVRFAAPALLAGNGGLLKHATNVTGCSFALESLFQRAGFPAGLFASLVFTNVDTGAAVNRVIADRRVAAVTLTGSERAGASVGAAAGAALKKTVLELGGSDPFVVLGDADIAAVAPLAVQARFTNSGQSCLCAKRFILEEGIAAEFERHFVPLVQALKMGDPRAEDTQIGPMAEERFVADLQRQVDESVAMGARLLVGGHRLHRPGSYFAPTVLADVTADMPVFREETFGPIAALVRARDAAHAIELADDTPYGLAASIWTADTARGLELGSGINSGALFINGVVASDPRLPFGGVKLSGYGRELSVEGLREFTNIRAVWTGDPVASA